MIEDLLLDPQLKWWMLIPITIAMVIVGLLRFNITTLLGGKPSLPYFKNARESDFFKRAMAFRENSSVLSRAEFNARSAYFVEMLNTDEFYAKKEDPESPANPFADINTNDALMNMAKGNLMNYVPQTLIMAWVNFFFAGSVVMKLPFPLTDGFKSMLQSGVNTPNLNARYVSAISWYFVNLFGLRPIYSLLMDDPDAAEELVKQSQQNTPVIGGPGAPKAAKAFASQAEAIQIIKHESVYDGITSRMIAKYSDKKTQ